MIAHRHFAHVRPLEVITYHMQLQQYCYSHPIAEFGIA